MRIVLNWETLQQVFYEAVEVDPSGRAAFLERRCDGDLPLRRQVESLLLALEEADQVIAPIHTAEIADALELAVPGSTTARKMVLERAIQSLQNLETEAGDDVSFRLELARDWGDVARIQNASGEAHLGDARGAVESLPRAIALLEPINRAEPAHREATLLWLELESALSRLKQTERTQSAGALLTQSHRLVGLIEPLYRTEPSDRTVTLAWCSAVATLARAYPYDGDLLMAHKQ